MKLVIVESPAKAKTINKYLGDDYQVLASYGHIRDLPSKDGSVRPEEDFEMAWQLSDGAGPRISSLKKAVKAADKVILATDPDREGEAISWHLYEIFKEAKLLNQIETERVVFNEVTKSAILKAMAEPRQLDNNLVDAYLARRALDYLVGFGISPILWRKLPGARSAGRVQSVALRLVVERESEIETFKSDEYWDIEGHFTAGNGAKLTASLTHLDGTKLTKLAIPNEAAAQEAVSKIKAQSWSVADIKTKRTQRHPAPPFTTSTLQQEASRKLGFSATRTMQIAQRLYEGLSVGAESTGLITYMRTDGVQMSMEAIGALRGQIEQQYGDSYLPEKPRFYKSKAANSQEAHEAIRPTDFRRTPEVVRAYLDHDQFRLYELIWKRAMASQFASAQLDQTAIELNSADSKHIMRATGSVIVFDGFLNLYFEGRDESQDAKKEDGKDVILPSLTIGEAMDISSVAPEQHFTQPPPRYTDASLVKELEARGIGRPSTYASIIQLLEKRGYVHKDRNRFFTEHRGRLTSSFLENFFEKYVEYDFTAALETKLDDISAGKMPYKDLLADFWGDFKNALEQTKELRITDVLNHLDADLEAAFFKPDENGEINRQCQKCQNGRLGLKLGKYGAFIGCSNYPECGFTRQINASEGDDDATLDEKELGQTQDGLPVFLRKGPYGFYVQAGALEEKKPKRMAVPKDRQPSTVDLEIALGLLALPREVGLHPETSDKIEASIGRFGPYLKYQGKFASLPKDEDVLAIGINRAVDILAEAAKKAGRTLGDHPDGGKVEMKKGRFGPYIEHNKLRAPVPRGTDMETITLEMGLEWLAKKAAQPQKKAAKKKSAKKKTATKKKATPKKKTAAKKAAKAKS
ncbi:MAG: type I DNA topoisomerase [Candidatus Puniceispirillaceae bacterium]